MNDLTPTIIASSTTGYISACVGSASAYPNIEQFTVSGNNLSGNVTLASPSGFQISLTASNGYSGKITLTPTGGTVDSSVIYVRSAPSAPQGVISGNVVLTSQGAAAIDVAVKGTVSAYLIVDPVSNQTVNSGSATAAVNFTGNADAYTWVNDNPSIGLPASGSGNISPFNTINNGSSPVTANITVTPKGANFAYIGNQGEGTISVINTNTNQITTTITVGGAPYATCVSPDGAFAYTANIQSNNVSVINTATNAVTATIPVGKTPTSLVVSPDGSRLYVGNFDGRTVSVINTTTNSVIATFAANTPWGLAISPDGTKLYVVNSGDVLVISTSTNTVIAGFLVPDGAIAAASTPDGTKLYVTSKKFNNISVINTSTYTVTTTIPVGNGPRAVCVNHDGSTVFVLNNGAETVSAINTNTNTIVASIPVGSGPIGISITPAGDLVYVTNSLSNNVSVINTATNSVVATIDVGSFPNSFGNFIIPGSKCFTPITFTITVNPTPPAVDVSGTLSTLTAKSGAASVTSSFNVSGSHIASGILVTAPTGYEVSGSASSGFGHTVTIGTSGTIPSTPVYVRLAAADAAGAYSGNIVCSAGSANVNEPTGSGEVNVSGNANLTGLVLSGGTLSPAFKSGYTSYTVSVPNSKTGITVKPTAYSPSAVIKVNGITVSSGATSGNIALSVGVNTISTTVNGTDGSSNTYSVAVTRAPSANDKLSNLHLSTGTLAPAFAQATTSYTASVGNGVASITETPTASDITASIKVNGSTVASGHVSGAIALNYGSNTIHTVVTAQDGTTTQTYTVNVTRQLSANANLTGLHLSNGGLTPSFSSNTTSYTANVNNSITQLTETPTSYDSHATIKVNGTTVASGAASAEIPLSVGSNAITTVVTAQNGSTTKTYTVTVTRASGGGDSFVQGISLSKPIPSPILLNDGITVHQGISPNGDGIGDFLLIEGISQYPDNKLAIMDRNGKLIYQATGYDNQTKTFDGHSNKTGQLQLPGTYFYQLEYKMGGVLKRKTGYVVLKY